MNAKCLLRLENATFGFGERKVLEEVNLTVRAGEFTGILGPNGAGKSTLLRGLLGLLAPRRGKLESQVATTGYVPQRENLDVVFPLSALEVVEMGAFGRLSRFGRLSAEDRALARDCLRRVGLAGREHDPYASFSGGQRQRTLIARALVTRPELLVLDEPTSGIDTKAQVVIMDLLANLNRDDGVAILFVTHSADSLVGVVDDVFWIADKRVSRIPLSELDASAALQTSGATD